MVKEVEIYEGGQLVKKEKMRLKMVKEMNEVVVYENEDGRAVLYFKEKDRYILVSNEMA
jgi:regulatory protein YycI of two-component signal transduction system YycFG